ncbi:MAG TPA: response regulator [Blastocatellia bacterium]|nr:response regulator [Blastocatellia bacterium]
MQQPATNASAGKIALIVDDLFFAAKIRSAAEAAGRKTQRIVSLDQLGSELLSDPPSVIFADLHADRVDPVEAIKLLKSHDKLREIPVIGFFSHVQVDFKRRAEDAGCDYVIPRSLFSQIVGKLVNGDLTSLPDRLERSV